MIQNGEYFASVDYLTLSGESQVVSSLWSELAELVTRYHNQGEKTHKLREFDYQGVRIGKLAYFDNKRNGYIRADGEAAPVMFALDTGFDLRCTRIDLQATLVDHPRNVPGSDGKMWVSIADLVHASAEASDTAPKPDLRKSPQGQTCYVGSWANDRFLRVYDKFRQDESVQWDKDTWRWEVELKQPRAHKIYHQLKALDPYERKEQIAGYIADLCDRWKVYHSIGGKRPSDLDDTKTRKSTSVERKLLWVESAVQPTVKTLLDPQGLGREYAVEILKALGIASSPIIAKHVLAILRQLGHN